MTMLGAKEREVEEFRKNEAGPSPGFCDVG